MIHTIYKALRDAFDPHKEVRQQAAEMNMHLMQAEGGWLILDGQGHVIAADIIPACALLKAKYSPK